MPAIPFEEHQPEIAEDVFLAPDAWAIGKVSIASQASVFFGSVLRGDIFEIRIGQGTNIQEHCMLHTTTGLQSCVVGNYVTVGHRAILHGCTVNDHALIGMGATILDGAEIGEYSIIGAQSLVPTNMKIPARCLALGVPAKIIREITDRDIESVKQGMQHYLEVSKVYREYFAKQ